jgi:hypothetical protein
MLRVGHTSVAQYNRKSSATWGSIPFALSPFDTQAVRPELCRRKRPATQQGSGRRVNSGFNSL